MAIDAYLIPNRLEDVIFLIQYLGLGKSYSLTKAAKDADGVTPRSSENWAALAKEHPEFFRVLESDSVTLGLRFYLRESGTPDRLEIDHIQKLIQTAMTLHERQAKRVEVWRGRVTMLAAVVAAITGIAGLYFKK